MFFHHSNLPSRADTMEKTQTERIKKIKKTICKLLSVSIFKYVAYFFINFNFVNPEVFFTERI